MSNITFCGYDLILPQSGISLSSSSFLSSSLFSQSSSRWCHWTCLFTPRGGACSGRSGTGAVIANWAHWHCCSLKSVSPQGPPADLGHQASNTESGLLFLGGAVVSSVTSLRVDSQVGLDTLHPANVLKRKYFMCFLSTQKSLRPNKDMRRKFWMSSFIGCCVQQHCDRWED